METGEVVGEMKSVQAPPDGAGETVAVLAEQILNTYAAQITKTSGPLAFRQAFGTYLIILAVVTAVMTVAAYFVAAPAFLAFVLLVAVEVILGLGQIFGSTNTIKAGAYVGMV